MILSFVSGCTKPSGVEQLVAFRQAGPIRPQADLTKIIQAQLPVEPYRAVIGDVIELNMPVILALVETQQNLDLEKTTPFLTRVREDGTINLPILGFLPAWNKTMPEIEKMAINAYYPRYMLTPPSIIARVSEYRTQPVAVVGAIKQPGVYPLRNDEFSLVNLIMKAGGITDEGAGIIRVYHANGDKPPEIIILPVKGMNIPFTDVVLRPGDRIEVEALNPEIFTVVGLVRKPGAFPYPPGVEYNIMQALAFAGGTDPIADPKYVKVYRQNPSGAIVDATFEIKGAQVPQAMGLKLKPGDVVSVEQTAATNARMLFSQIFRVYFNFGGNTNLWD